MARPENLTRRCGAAEEVREVLKISLCSLRSLRLKFLRRLIQPRTSGTEGRSAFRRLLEASAFLDGFAVKLAPETGAIQALVRLTQYVNSRFKQSVTALSMVAPLPPSISLRSLRSLRLKKTNYSQRPYFILLICVSRSWTRWKFMYSDRSFMVLSNIWFILAC